MTRRRFNRISIVLFAAVLGIVVAFAFMVNRYLNAEVEAAPDYEGDGSGSVLLRVESGQSLGEIGDNLYDIGTIASTRAFVGAAQGTQVESIQPGYYQLRREMSADSTVELLADPQYQVGSFEVRPGARLLDTEVVGGDRELGIFHLIANATCMRDLDAPEAEPDCRTPQEIVDASVEATPEELGVPDWAMDEVSNAPDEVRRLEGLISPGMHIVDPTAEPVEILRGLIEESAAWYESTDLVAAADRIGLTPYHLLTSASLVEKEGLTEDFPMVARVILNRLEEPMQLQFDSTVNYALPDQEVATTDEARGEQTPWNTYAMDGLPYGPIATPGQDALLSMENPADGPWLYFVTVDMEGTTRFTEDYAEHQANQAESIANGVLVSGR